MRKKFNEKSKLPHKFALKMGDWSDDGHGEEATVTFQCSHSLENLERAYLESVQNTGISFHNARNRSEKNPVEICTEYEQCGLSPAEQKKLAGLGYDLSKISNVGQLEPQELADVILWFIKLSLPALEYTQKDYRVTKRMPRFYAPNNSNFGYGLFGI